MTDLTDCFAPQDAPLTAAEARGRFAAGLKAIAGRERVPLRRALGRILAEDLIAADQIPPHDNSAVDGFAVYFDDLAATSETVLPVTGRIAAGHPLDRPARPGEALEIFTGAPLPAGPDTVFMIEDCTRENDHVRLPPGIKRGDNRRHAGEDVRPGDRVVARGARLRPQEVGMAASLGRAELDVFAALKVAVFSTGDEIRDPRDGGERPEGCIFDINRYAIIGLLERMGCAVTDLGIFADDPAPLAQGLAGAAADHDLLVTSGGVSMGAEDHVRTVVEKLGRLSFWKLAIKPGRPIALGAIGRDGGETPFIGLPGNPVAAMVTFLGIARPIVLLLGGATDTEPRLFQVKAGFDFTKKPGRREWLRASLELDDAGCQVATKFPVGGSGILSSMVAADGLIELAEEVETVAKGDAVDFLPFSEVM